MKDVFRSRRSCLRPRRSAVPPVPSLDKSLREEALQQPLNHRMLKMQLHHFISHLVWITKHNWADGRLAPPLENVLILLAFYAQGIGRADPAGASRSVERRNRIPRGSSAGPGIGRNPSQPASASAQSSVA